MRLIIALLSIAWSDVRVRDVSNGLQMKSGFSDSVHFKFKLSRSDKPSLVSLLLYTENVRLSLGTSDKPKIYSITSRDRWSIKARTVLVNPTRKRDILPSRLHGLCTN